MTASVPFAAAAADANIVLCSVRKGAPHQNTVARPVNTTQKITPAGRKVSSHTTRLSPGSSRLAGRRIVKRTHEGRQIARANGVKMGRKPKLNPHQIKEARQRLAKGERTRDLAYLAAAAMQRQAKRKRQRGYEET